MLLECLYLQKEFSLGGMKIYRLNMKKIELNFVCLGAKK